MAFRNISTDEKTTRDMTSFKGFVFLNYLYIYTLKSVSTLKVLQL